MVSGWTVTPTCSTIAAPAETRPFRPSSGMAACFLSHAGHPVSATLLSRLGGRQMPEVTCSLDRAGLRVIDVLLVEDDPGDVLMTTEAFEIKGWRKPDEIG